MKLSAPENGFWFGKSIMIGATIRNGGPKLVERIRKIEAVFSGARKIQWVVVESDSTDNTAATIRNLSLSASNFNGITLNQLATSLPQRTARLAYCRNLYLDALQGQTDSVDFLVVADLDGVNDGLTRESLMTCSRRKDWDVCTANQRSLYYDIWALRHAIWSPNDCQTQFAFFRDHGCSEERAAWAAVYSRMIRIDPTSPWIRVESAFGGLAIYRRHFLTGARYVGITDAGQEICEHVTFHQQLGHQEARIFINPGLINGGINEHSAAAGCVASFRRQVKRQLRRLFRPGS